MDHPRNGRPTGTPPRTPDSRDFSTTSEIFVQSGPIGCGVMSWPSERRAMVDRPNHLYYGDNLAILRERIPEESVDCYICC
jgi:hypothetical protein